MHAPSTVAGTRLRSAGADPRDTPSSAASAVAASRSDRRPSRWRHEPALDGLRGLAVLAVVLYHAGVGWLPGGLLGVDAFFVLSGFLITGLLLNEWHQRAAISLGGFWARRARRLLPALVLLLLLVGVQLAVTGDPSGRASFPKDAISVLTYVANWRFAFSHQGYFGASSPSPLLHTWSLGVEEQFYLLWPLIVAGVLVCSRRERNGYRRVLIIGVAGAAASTALMFALAATGTSTDRLYYGTDTRAAALLVGAALAAWRAFRSVPGFEPASPSGASRRTGRVLAAGYLGLAVTFAMWLTTAGEAGWLYRGGFLVMALSVGAVIAGVFAAPRSGLARLLRVRPLRGLGRISYGVYLFHWPLFLLIDHARTGLSGPALLLARCAATLTLALLSYVLVERPIRTRRPGLPRSRLAVGAAASVATVVVLALLVGNVHGPTSADFNARAAQVSRESAKRLAQLRNAPPPASNGPVAHEPARLLVVGDSVAFSAGWALSSQQQRYSIDLLSEAVLGCGIVPYPYADQRSASPVPAANCTRWPQQWKEAVDRFRPAVTAVILGRWEITDRLVDGRTEHIGQPDFDRRLKQQLDQAIAILSAHSGKVALIAMPCSTLPEQPDGSTIPSNGTERIARYDDLIGEVAAQHPGVATVVDIRPQICPGGQVIKTYHGMPLRTADGVHFDLRAGPALGQLLLPPLRRIAGLPATPAR